jgi:hypothetical protein
MPNNPTRKKAAPKKAAPKKAAPKKAAPTPKKVHGPSGQWNSATMKKEEKAYHAAMGAAPKTRRKAVHMKHDQSTQTMLSTGKKGAGRFVSVPLSMGKKRNPNGYTKQQRACYKSKKGGACYVTRNALPLKRCPNGNRRKRNGKYVAASCTKK